LEEQKAYLKEVEKLFQKKIKELIDKIRVLEQEILHK
jgi:hypothetical protein